jgi:hypothetical protein
MSSSRILLVLLGLILGLILGLHRAPNSSRHQEWLDHDPGSARPSSMRATGSPGAPVNPLRRSSGLSGLVGIEIGAGSAESSDSPRTDPITVPSETTMDAPDLQSLVMGLEGASTGQDKALWADRIAAHGGSAAVEALIRLGAAQSEPAHAEILRDAFKGLSTEEDMAALVDHLKQLHDPDWIEAVVETLARGARATTVENLARLHGADSTPASGHSVVGWAIERIRNPEASVALAELARSTDQPELSDAATIALFAIRSEGGAAVPEAPSP